MVAGPQRHPSRDRPPQSYVNVGDKGQVDFSGMGRYTPEDIEHATRAARSDPGGFPEEAKTFLQPVQGALFNAENWERASAVKLGRQRLRTSSYDAESTMASAMSKSTIPTSHLQPRRSPGGKDLPDTSLFLKSEDPSGYNWQGVGGYYRTREDTSSPDTVALASGGAMVHELGHRRHLGTTPSWDESVTHPRGLHPDPLKEGVADAYEDRYGGLNSGQVRAMNESIEHEGKKFPSYMWTGYSADEHAAKQRGWGDPERALYVAGRGHASETGEQPTYIPRGRDMRESSGLADFGGGDPTIDATLHHLLSTSPHAAQALRQTGLKDVGAQAFRRHRDRQLLASGQSVQMSMLNAETGAKSGKVHGYTVNLEATPDTDFETDERILDENEATRSRLEAKHGESVFPDRMNRNQFGEKPRTTSDISHSLGVSREVSKKKGFDAW